MPLFRKIMRFKGILVVLPYKKLVVVIIVFLMYSYHMDETNIIWTEPMKEFKAKLDVNDNVGLYSCSLSDEDRQDFVEYLRMRNIPVIVLTAACDTPYLDLEDCDGNIDIEPVFNILIIRIYSHDKISVALENELIEQNNVDVSASTIGVCAWRGMEAPSRDPEHCYQVRSFSKYTAHSIMTFLRNGVILASREACEILTREYDIDVEGIVRDEYHNEERIIYRKGSKRFVKGNVEYTLKNGTNNVSAIVDALVVKKKDNITEKEIFCATGAKCRGGRDRRVEESVRHLNLSMKEKLCVDCEMFEYKDRCVMLSAGFKDKFIIE